MSNRHGRPHGSERDHRDREPPRAAPRKNDYFIPAESIAREVIQADICRYLGRDALVRPCDYQGRPGYLITAYRNLTTEMIEDLKTDSSRWAEENRENREAGFRAVAYSQSNTYAGTYDDRPPSTSAPQGYQNYPGRGGALEPEPGRNQQYYNPPQPTQPNYGGNPGNYILQGQGQDNYGQPQRNYPPGNPSGPYGYEPRQDGYQPRTPQSQDDLPNSRVPAGYAPPYGGPQQIGSSGPGQSGQPAYIDPNTGRAIYMESGYEPVAPSRQGGGPQVSGARVRDSGRGDQPRRLR